MSGASLDLLGAQPTSVAARQQRRRGSSNGSYDRRSAKAATAGVHGGSSGYIGSVSAGIYKSFRERFMSGAGSAGSGGSSSDVDYRALRQRDAEAGKLSSSDSSSDEQQQQEAEGLSSSSSVEDLFASEAERRKTQPERRSTTKGKRRRRKVSAARSGPGLGLCSGLAFHFACNLLRYSVRWLRLLPLRA